MIRLPPLPTMRDIIRLYRLRAIKQLSQNFIMDLRLTNKIVRTAGNIRNGEVCEVTTNLAFKGIKPLQTLKQILKKFWESDLDLYNVFVDFSKAYYDIQLPTMWRLIKGLTAPLKVGPGPGSITRSIIMREPRRLVLIEKDPRFVPALKLLAESSPTEVITEIGDVLEFDMSKSFEQKRAVSWDEPPPNIHIIGNLPFSVSTPLIIRWLRDIHHRRSAWNYGRVKMTLTFQQEVAERICAPILSSQRGRLSVMCQNWCEVSHRMTIPGKAFVPKPDVDVGVVHFVPRVEPIIAMDIDLVERVLRHIFSFRQKFCIKGAMTLFPKTQREELGKEMFGRADVNPETRPFQVSVEEYGRLCAAYKVICDREPRLLQYDHRANRKDKEHRWDYFQEEEEDENDDNNDCSNEKMKGGHNVACNG